MKALSGAHFAPRAQPLPPQDSEVEISKLIQSLTLSEMNRFRLVRERHEQDRYIEVLEERVEELEKALNKAPAYVRATPRWFGRWTR